MEFKRFFTPKEAGRALPLVRQIVSDILDTAKKIRDLDSSNGELRRLQGVLQKLLLELEDLGCFYKDWNYTAGLVDFPSIVNGETVFLCWRSDENELGWFHSLDEGYAGRKPLPKSL